MKIKTIKKILRFTIYDCLCFGCPTDPNWHDHTWMTKEKDGKVFMTDQSGDIDPSLPCVSIDGNRKKAYKTLLKGCQERGMPPQL